MSRLKLRLADGSEIDATIETAISAGLRDLLATGYAGNQMRVAGDESDDVEGHALDATVQIRLFDEDDTEGQAMTLRLPDAQAARDLQRKLLAAGVAGLIVVGAATTAVVVSTGQTASTGASAQAAPVAAAPDAWYNDTAQAAPLAPDAWYVESSTPIAAPLSANPAARDRGAEDAVTPAVAAPLVAPLSANPAARDRGAEDAIAPAVQTPVVAPKSADPGVRDRDGDSAKPSTDSGSQSAPGEPRLR